MLLRVGQTVINTALVQRWIVLRDCVEIIYGVDNSQQISRPEHVTALTRWLADHSIDVRMDEPRTIPLNEAETLAVLA